MDIEGVGDGPLETEGDVPDDFTPNRILDLSASTIACGARGAEITGVEDALGCSLELESSSVETEDAVGLSGSLIPVACETGGGISVVNAAGGSPGTGN